MHNVKPETTFCQLKLIGLLAVTLCSYRGDGVGHATMSNNSLHTHLKCHSFH